MHFLFFKLSFSSSKSHILPTLDKNDGNKADDHFKTTASDTLIRGNSGNHLGEETVCPKDLDLDSDF